MIPVGYMAKRVHEKTDWIGAPQVVDLYSVSGCISENFTDYINYWKHNGYWLFDAPAIIQGIAQENSMSLDGVSLFYYEAYELEFEGGNWKPYSPRVHFSDPRGGAIQAATRRLRRSNFLVQNFARVLPAFL